MSEKQSKIEKQSITIDGKKYFLDDLSEQIKLELGSLRATDVEIARVEATLAMLKTARAAYARAAKEGLAE